LWINGTETKLVTVVVGVTALIHQSCTRLTISREALATSTHRHAIALDTLGIFRTFDAFAGVFVFANSAISSKPWIALTGVRSDFVDALCVVIATVEARLALVHVGTDSFVPQVEVLVAGVANATEGVVIDDASTVGHALGASFLARINVCNKGSEKS
jgi:hypothetical protein